MPDKETTKIYNAEHTETDSRVPMIEVRNLCKRFGDTEVLKNVSFTIYKGETCVLIGASGGGKTTILKCLIGALKSDSGEIRIGGHDITKLKQSQLNEVRKKFGVLFQSAALFNSMNVKDNIALPIRYHTDLPEKTIDALVKTKLELVELRNVEELYPAQLSGGMKKRVGLARAIALDPEIIFFDEPTAGLDPIVANVIDELIIDFTRKLKITSLIITHDMQSAFKIADKIIMLAEGKVIKIGTPSEFKKSNNPLILQFIASQIKKDTARRERDSSRFIDPVA